MHLEKQYEADKLKRGEHVQIGVENQGLSISHAQRNLLDFLHYEPFEYKLFDQNLNRVNR